MTESARLALITGSSRGIGKAIAIDLAATGVDILATGRDETRLHNVKKEIEGFGVEAHVVSADLGTDQGINKLHKYLETNDLSVDILVNNAAIIHPRLSLVDFEISEWERVIDVNLIAAMKLTKLVLPAMIANNYGKIINISSIGGRKGAAGRSAYRVTKAGLISFTESIAAEVKHSGIDVNCICPGSVLTEGYVEAFGPQEDGEVRMMDPVEIAKLCTFLISPDSSAVTGATIDAFGSTNPLFSS